MYTSQPPVTAAAPRTATPPQLFVGSQRVLAAAWYFTLYTFSITLHLAFIVGARKLRGWKANFSFTLLLYLSTMALLYLTTHMIGSITALLYMDWFKYQILWILLGSFAYAAIFTVILTDVVIALHRLIYTVWPLIGSNRISVLATKVSIMMVEEVGFFVYWEFFPVHAQFGADVDIVIAESALMLFLDVLVLPYLVLNRNIHSELKRVLGLQKKNTSALLWLRTRVDVVTRAA
ncbi:unnamed protein product [Haemonchus placei]|uniref:Serpentine receptor class gamma n=1 Tax=Haemonchus placei TaxID=6290 RepID=A0A0N4WCU9_HAEPC|nr:unnamed protein product [Haemonchus placei]